MIACETPAEALKICADEHQRIDLLLSDAIMPDMLGPELVTEARSMRPELPVIFMSGYSYSILDPQQLDGHEKALYLEKPFTTEQLLSGISELIGPGWDTTSG